MPMTGWPTMGIRGGVALGFVRRTQAAPFAEGMSWVCRMSYWASPDETGLLAPRPGVIFRPARPIRLLAALLAPRLEILLDERTMVLE